MAVENNDNVGIAFGLTIGAGLSTALGAAVVFVPSLVRFASRRTLAGALGLSAGVMTYVSFVEIFQKSIVAFEDHGFDEDMSYVYATVCFFGGVVLMVTLNYIVTWLLGGHHHHHGSYPSEKRTDSLSNTSDTQQHQQQQQQHQQTHTEENITFPCCSEDPVGDLRNVHHMAEEMQAKQGDHHEQDHKKEEEEKDDDEEEADRVEEESKCCDDSQCEAQGHEECEEGKEEDDEEESDDSHQHHLMRMSINTAIAIGLHNFPEGIATFIATLNDPGVGFVLAGAIAIHNIPEGLCVAMPIYYATGKRWKAFGWALFSGLAEPVAALLAWAVLANYFTDMVYGILFGIVAGMMVIISARELLPTAHRYDPDDTVVTYTFMAGMGIMALSLVLFMI